MKNSWKNWSIRSRSATFLVLLLIISEILVRTLGLVDFPTYQVSDDVGYIPTPNQSGAFLRRNDWVFNNRSMGVATPWSTGTQTTNLLLIGNSVVMGGNPYKQDQKLGPLIQASLGSGISVWPMAAGGWTVINEIANLRRNQDVVYSNNFFVWQIMSGGFGSLANWRGDLLFPRKRPMFALWYVARRYVLSGLLAKPSSELPPVVDATKDGIRQFEGMVGRLATASHRRVPGIFLLYPTEQGLNVSKLGWEWLPERSEIERIARIHGIRVIDLALVPQWHSSDYRDGIHPTVEGNLVLSRILAKAISEDLTTGG